MNEQIKRLEILTEDIICRLEENVNEVALYAGKPKKFNTLDPDDQKAKVANQSYIKNKNKRNQLKADLAKLNQAKVLKPSKNISNAIINKEVEYKQAEADASRDYSAKVQANKEMRYNNANRTNVPSVNINGSYEFISFEELLQEAKEIDEDIIKEAAEEAVITALEAKKDKTKEQIEKVEMTTEKNIEKIEQSKEKFKQNNQGNEKLINAKEDQFNNQKEQAKAREENITNRLQNSVNDINDKITALKLKNQAENTADANTVTNEALDLKISNKQYAKMEKWAKKEEKQQNEPKTDEDKKQKKLENKKFKILQQIQKIKIKIASLEQIKARKGESYNKEIDEQIEKLTLKIKTLEEIIEKIDSNIISLGEEFVEYIDSILSEESVQISNKLIKKEEKEVIDNNSKYFTGIFGSVIKYLATGDRSSLSNEDKILLLKIEREPSILAYKKQLISAIKNNNESEINKIKKKIIAIIDRTKY